MKDWFDRQTFSCSACGKTWIMRSDKTFTKEQHNIFWGQIIREHQNCNPKQSGKN